MTHRNAGAASALTLALAAGFFAATNFSVALFSGHKTESTMEVRQTIEANPVAGLLDLVRAVAADPKRAGELHASRGSFARNVAAFATIARNDDDARQAEAIAALGIAGSPEALEALRDISQHGSPVDAELADAAMGAAGTLVAVP